MIDLKVDGIDQLKTNLTALRPALEAEFPLIADIATTRIVNVEAQYPPEPSGSRYIRTGNYGAQLHGSVVSYGSSATGYAEQGATYSVYLRGYADGSYEGAWMHRGSWDPLVTIIEAETPGIEDMADERVSAVIVRVMGA